MINKLLELILNLVISLMSFFLNIVTLPLTALIKTLFPGIEDFIGFFDNLLTTYLIPGLRFARAVILNITGINANLIGILAMLPLTYLLFTIANAGVRLIVSLYRLYKTGKDD